MKLTKHAWSLWAIALAVVFILAFMLPFVRTEIFYISLAFTVAMFALCAFAFIRAFRKDETPESKLLGWPIFKVAALGTAVQIAVGYAFMALAVICPVWVVTLIELLLFAAVLASITVKDAVREAADRTERQTKDTTAEWKTVRARIAAIAAASGNPDIKKIAEDIRFADPVETVLDGQVANAVEEVGSDASEENIQELKRLLSARKSAAKTEA